ncbi:winged helix-turn-helix transcriptional regulator [Rhizobium sp. P32RR-XVIII]|uniref:winged helix-turn-helix domain-containing protein n=1 Tax=Rhizobium sp. P32RR-XVIII TaxID=2726738 RepID=UPI00145793A2|nr:winged helix-turn-helix domain-containing protein [Rhizobium sp. P32RR-XVIII]NLS02310.1 winged helix-turn-helix transcriptional regulator [Rhizobium sp. P32RR-XVIII]
MTILTEQTGPASDGLWVTVAELARRKNITRQTASEKIARLEKDGLLQTRKDGRSRLVELATFDRLIGETGDAFKEQSAQTKRAAQIAATPLRDSQADKVLYEAKLKALDFGERTGQLVPLQGDHGIEAALVKVSDKIVRDLGAPMNWVTDLIEAARNGGEPALRRVMQGKIRDLRKAVAEHLMELAGEANEAERSGIQVDIHFEGDE